MQKTKTAMSRRETAGGWVKNVCFLFFILQEALSILIDLFLYKRQTDGQTSIQMPREEGGGKAREHDCMENTKPFSPSVLQLWQPAMLCSSSPVICPSLNCVYHDVQPALSGLELTTIIKTSIWLMWKMFQNTNININFTLIENLQTSSLCENVFCVSRSFA